MFGEVKSLQDDIGTSVKDLAVISLLLNSLLFNQSVSGSCI